jgi:Xaa-Pro aminopeptidase
VRAPSNLTGICDRSIQSKIDGALDGSLNVSDVIAAVEPRLWAMATVLPIMQDTTIVAAGPNGALPHAEPGERVIGKGELVVFDMGSKLDGYCSDCTRTVATGDLDEQAREIYEVTLKANESALEAVAAGKSAAEIDACFAEDHHLKHVDTIFERVFGKG